MSICTECKNFLDTNSITDVTSYRKWMSRNHPDKFRKFGLTDPSYINATEQTKKVSDCFPKWYGSGKEKTCGTLGGLGISTSIEEKNKLLVNSVIIGDISSVKELIAAGADINYRNKEQGITLLMYALNYNHKFIVYLLLEAGANPNIKDLYGNIPLNLAVYNPKDDINVVNALIKAGSHINNQNSTGDTALTLATRKKINIDILNALVIAGININIQNNDGMTALMYASRGHDVRAINILLEAGADINLKNNRGQTALDIATEKNLSIEIINIISLKSKRSDAGYKKRRKKSGGKRKKSINKNKKSRNRSKKSGGRKKYIIT